MDNLKAGIDIGGTKTEIAVINGAGAILHCARSATPPDYPDLISTVTELVRAAKSQLGIAFTDLGVGAPGSISPKTGLMRNSPTAKLDGHSLDGDLTAATGCAVRVENDANAFALAEATLGSAAGANMVFGVVLGTGVGGGLVVGGRIHAGPNRIGGEWGHTPLASDTGNEAPICPCGRRGCVEAWCSGPALVLDHAQEAGLDAEPDMIAALAESGDGQAQATLDRHRDRLGRALARVINTLDPDAIVIGGGLSNLPNLIETLPNAIRPHVFSETFQTPIRKASLGDSAGAIGAALLLQGNPQ